MANFSIIQGPNGQSLVVHGLTADELEAEEANTDQWSGFAEGVGLKGGILTTLTIENALAAEERADFPQLFVEAVDDEDTRVDELEAGLTIVAEADEPLTIVYQQSEYHSLVDDIAAHFADDVEPLMKAAELLDTLQLHGIDIDVKPDEDA